MTTFSEIINAGNVVGSSTVSHPSGSGGSFDNGSTSIIVASHSSFSASGFISVVDHRGETQLLHYKSKSIGGSYQSLAGITGWEGVGNVEHDAPVIETNTPFTEVSIT